MNFLKQLSPYRKAVVAFVIGVLQLVIMLLSLLNDADGLTPADQITLLSSVVLALGGTAGVYQVKNTRS